MSDFTENPVFDISEADAEGVESSYNGPRPRARLLMPGEATAFLTRDKNKAPMLKVLFKVTEGKYAGYTAWENASITPAAAFKWKELCDDVFMVTTEDLQKRTKIDLSKETNAGYRVKSIGDLNFENEVVPVMFAVAYRTHTDDFGNESEQTNVVMAWNVKKDK